MSLPRERLVVLVTVPFPPDPALAPRLRKYHPHAEVHFLPYNESREARAARGANNGVLPEGIATPTIAAEHTDLWAAANIVVGIDLPPNVTEIAPSLRWFQTVSAGVDQVDQAALASKDVRLSSASGIASDSIAEFVMARLLAVWKNLRSIEANQRAETWVESFGSEVTGRTMVIVGLGSIGRAVARRASAFGMTVLATRNSAQSGDVDPEVDELHPASDLSDLLPRADAVVCALPASPTTVDLFDEAMFRQMKKDAIFCNVGRGTLVVEDDLVRVLHDGHLRAAVLDVMRTEPLPADNPLWNAPRAYISPHAAVSLDRYKDNAWSILEDNLRRYLAGEKLHNEIDLAKDEQ